MASSDDAADTMKIIMEKLHSQAEDRAQGENPLVLEVFTREDQVRPKFAETCRKWADAAYAGDWDTIISVSQSGCFTEHPASNIPLIE
jgi:hypothetical protein